MTNGRATGTATTGTRRRQGRPSGGLGMLGPAFVVGIAYVDPGNVATNVSAGANHGYLLVWVIVLANLMAMLIQYLSAKLGLATGRSLPAMCRERYPRPVSRALWVQAELVALATDLAEVLGGALALYLLFGLPLVVGGLTTIVASLAILLLQTKRSPRRFEAVVVALLVVIAVGFVYPAVIAGPDASAAAGGLLPRLDGTDSLLLAVGMLGATVMPHAIYLHSELVPTRFPGARTTEAKRAVLVRTRSDVMLSMAVAGAVNLVMLLMAAAVLPAGTDSIEAAHAELGVSLGAGAALLFAVALLASGLASTAVGTYAGTVILTGFTGLHLPIVVRRLVTVIPALVILGIGVEPTLALVFSQVVLSLGIPFALIPLLHLTQDRALMGPFTNRSLTTCVGVAVAVAIVALNLTLVALTLGPVIGL
jgi:manganese transport protein